MEARIFMDGKDLAIGYPTPDKPESNRLKNLKIKSIQYKNNMLRVTGCVFKTVLKPVTRNS